MIDHDRLRAINPGTFTQRFRKAVLFTFNFETGLWGMIGFLFLGFALLIFSIIYLIIAFDFDHLPRFEKIVLTMLLAFLVFFPLIPIILPIAVFPAMKIYFEESKMATITDWFRLLSANKYRYLKYCSVYTFAVMLGLVALLAPGIVYLVQGAMGWLETLNEKPKPNQPLLKSSDETVFIAFWQYVGGAILTGIFFVSSLFILIAILQVFSQSRDVGEAVVIFAILLMFLGYGYLWTLHYVMFGLLYYEQNPPGIDDDLLAEINNIGRE